MQDTELAGGSAEVDIVVAGVRKCHGIPDVVKHINKAGTTNGSDVALTEDKCELLESKDKDRPPPRTWTIKCSIKREFKAMILNADFWPDGCYVREFNHPRPPRKQVGGSFGS